MRLHVGELRVKELLNAIDCKGFDFIDEFAAAVITLARITFRIFVRQHRTLSLKNGARDNVLRRNQFDLRLLAFQLFQDGAAYWRVAGGKRFVEERGGGASRGI